MARKMNAWRSSQEARGQAAITNRQPAPLTAALYLAQLHPQPLKVSPPSGRRLQITIKASPCPEVPRPVKIIQAG